jgi:hypothetical protein
VIPSSLPARELTPEELAGLVHDLAARRDDWEHLVRYDSDNRWFECLHRDSHVDVWLISWVDEQDTGWHDHDVSSGAVAVVEGELLEERLVLAGAPHRRLLPAGTGTRFDPSHVHRLRLGDGQERAVSVHAYSPPLWRLGVYTVDDEGALRRESVSYAEELRPVA